MNAPLPQILADSVIGRRPEHVTADMDGQTALMSIENGKYYCLNPVATDIWSLIEQPRRVREICDWLQGQYEVDSDQCVAEVTNHIGELIQENLAEVASVAGE